MKLDITELKKEVYQTIEKVSDALINLNTILIEIDKIESEEVCPIEKFVKDEFGYTFNDLKIKSKKEQYLNPRQLAIY